jgi:REP element-mobilizing transposase RayT
MEHGATQALPLHGVWPDNLGNDAPLHDGENRTMSQHRFRKNVRMPEYDYRLPGNYFITICTVERQPFLGSIVGAEVRLSELGRIVEAAWHDIPNHHHGVALDAIVIMPNHVHGIISILSDEGGMPLSQDVIDAMDRAATQSTFRGGRKGSLGTIAGSFKSASTRNINRFRGTQGATVWQLNYYEHIIRNERSLEQIRAYIAGNPANWDDDPENPYKR